MLYLDIKNIHLIFLKKILFEERPLTHTECQVKDAESDVQPEEEDHVGHFAEQKHVAYVLLQRNWGWERGGNREMQCRESFSTTSKAR